MAYFERFKIKNTNDQTINPAEQEGIVLLRRIFQALKPFGVITGGGSNRLSIDINSGTITTISNISAGTITTVNNIANIGGVTGFEHMKAVSRQSYNSGPRSRVT